MSLHSLGLLIREKLGSGGEDRNVARLRCLTLPCNLQFDVYVSCRQCSVILVPGFTEMNVLHMDRR